MRALAVACALAVMACKVADIDLEGKACPCASGYRCNDTTQTCVRDGETIDGGADAPDAPVFASCLGIPQTQMPSFTDEFNTFTWMSTGGAWAGQGGEGRQADRSATLAYAYPPSLPDFGTSYHVVAQMRQLASGVNGGAIEIAFRMQVPSSNEMYHCNFGPNTHDLIIQHTNALGLGGTQLAAKVIDVSTNPAYDPMMTVTMEVSANGMTATCCIREIPGASVTASNVPLLSGPPGLKTWNMSGAFDSFRVYDF